MKIKKGDNVVVLAGKDKGKKGIVVKSMPKLDRLVVEGVNMRKKHQKARRAGAKGQIIEFPASLHISNVKLAESKKKPTAKANGYDLKTKD